MSNLLNNFFLTFLFLIFSVSLHAKTDNLSGTLTVKIMGLTHDHGQVIANLFREGSDVMKIQTVYRRAQTKIINNEAVVTFANLEYGLYAVSVFHDENKNEDLDHNFLNLPAEPLGFSNAFKLGLFSGLPSFKKLKFSFSQETSQIEIRVK